MQYLFAEDIRNERVEVIVFRGGKQVTIYVQPIVLIQDYYAVQVDPLEQFGAFTGHYGRQQYSRDTQNFEGDGQHVAGVGQIFFS